MKGHLIQYFLKLKLPSLVKQKVFFLLYFNPTNHILIRIGTFCIQAVFTLYTRRCKAVLRLTYSAVFLSSRLMAPACLLRYISNRIPPYERLQPIIKRRAIRLEKNYGFVVSFRSTDTVNNANRFAVGSSMVRWECGKWNDEMIEIGERRLSENTKINKRPSPKSVLTD